VAARVCAGEADGTEVGHLYRLTAAGLASATGALASAAGPPARLGARAARTGRDVVAPVVSGLSRGAARAGPWAG
jgi:hypothetical protein